jgi:DNA mismatch endonuclease, patch repair protein
MTTNVPRYDLFTPSSRLSSATKQRNRREGGKAEILLRSMLWRKGLRFRKHAVGLPGCPDIVFTKARLAVFVDGDFWHGRNWSELRSRLQFRANPDYWIAKIARNIDRDIGQTRQLETAGWTVLRVWETELLSDPEICVRTIEERLKQRGSGNAPSRS